jgi:hypothetical protein
MNRLIQPEGNPLPHRRSAGSPLAALLAPFVLFALASCATFPPDRGHPPTDRERALALVSLVNSGSVSGTEGILLAPFAFDGEILYLEGDVLKLWKNLEGASFSLEGASIESCAPAGDDAWTLFGDTPDMQRFFRAYSGKDSLIAAFDTDRGRWLFLLEGSTGSFPGIRGLKGPDR